MGYIKQLKPENYQELRWIKREGYYYNQPAIFINDVFSHWGFPSGLSEKWRKCLEYLNSDSIYWKNDRSKDKAFLKIWEFNNDTCSSITKLSLFEIFLLNNDFEINSFGALSTRDPYRCYIKGNKQINILCSAGMTSKSYIFEEDELKLQSTTPFPPFCVQISGIEFYISHEEKDYENIINMKGKPVLNHSLC